MQYKYRYEEQKFYISIANPIFTLVLQIGQVGGFGLDLGI